MTFIKVAVAAVAAISAGAAFFVVKSSRDEKAAARADAQAKAESQFASEEKTEEMKEEAEASVEDAGALVRTFGIIAVIALLVVLSTIPGFKEAVINNIQAGGFLSALLLPQAITSIIMFFGMMLNVPDKFTTFVAGVFGNIAAWKLANYYGGTARVLTKVMCALSIFGNVIVLAFHDVIKKAKEDAAAFNAGFKYA